MPVLKDNQQPSNAAFTMVERDKQKVMKQQEKGAFYSSVAGIATFMAGILVAAGMGIAGPALAAGGLSAVPAMGIAFLAVAAVSTLTAVYSNMQAQKITSSAYFDQSETNAKHNAKYIVQEFAKSACHEHEKPREYEQNQRADGQQWAAVVSRRSEIAEDLGLPVASAHR